MITKIQEINFVKVKILRKGVKYADFYTVIELQKSIVTKWYFLGIRVKKEVNVLE